MIRRKQRRTAPLQNLLFDLDGARPLKTIHNKPRLRNNQKQILHGEKGYMRHKNCWNFLKMHANTYGNQIRVNPTQTREKEKNKKPNTAGARKETILESATQNPTPNVRCQHYGRASFRFSREVNKKKERLPETLKIYANLSPGSESRPPPDQNP
jgi:hypothetical protein